MRGVVSGLIFTGALLLALPAAAEVNAYLRLDATGSARQPLAATLDLTSITYGSGRAVMGLPIGVGPERDDLHTLRIVRPNDGPSQAIWRAEFAGDHFSKAMVYVRQDTGAPFRAYLLTDVTISAFETDGARGADRFTLDFDHIETAPDATAEALGVR
jgi:hypothetical protein